MHHLPSSCLKPARLVKPAKNVLRQPCCVSDASRRVGVPHALGNIEAASASILGSLLAAGVVVATEADVQTVYRPDLAEVQVVQAPQQVQLPQQLPTAGPTPFDIVLLSIIHVTDELSLAADGLLELTAAADPSCAEGISSLGYTSTNSSSSAGASAVMSGSLQLLPVMQQAPAPAGQQEGSPAQQQQQQAEVSTAYRMSQQALAMATEALKLATLLDGQNDGRDPVEQELLQQIAAAARLVSVMASDIVQPAGYDDAAGLDDSSMDTVSTSAAAVPAPSTAEGVEASVPGGSNISNSSSVAGAAGLHNFAGLPLLGLQVQDTTCQVAQLDAVALQHCLRL